MTKRILITGAAGFVFSNVSRYILAHRDWRIVTLDRLDEAGTLARLSAMRHANPDRLACVWHDLRAAINPLHFDLLAQPFDYIVHGAACSHVNRATLDPVSAIYDNVIGTAHLLDYVRRYQSQAKTLVVSTDEVFGPAAEDEEFHEHSRHEPANPYSAAKSGGETLCPAYAHQYGLNIVVTRCCNVFGPNQYMEKFIPLCTHQILNGETVQIHARDGVVSSRLYIHVDDVAEATLTVLEKGGVIHDPSSGRYNIRAQREWSNLEVAQRIADMLGITLRYELVENPPGRPKPDMRYAISDAKLRALGWAPRVSLEDGLAEVVAEIVAERGRRAVA